METNKYHAQADQFLQENGLNFRATLSDTKTPAWADAEKHGHHYRVMISRDKSPRPICSGTTLKPDRLTFDFWGGIAAARSGKHPRAYDVLACISSDACAPETFEDWCAEYGDSPDSIKALQTFRRCAAFAKRLRAFFTPGRD